MTAINKGKKRKELRKSIAAKLELALADLQNDMKEKKFKAAIKRASKLLANDLYTKPAKEKKSEYEVPVNLGA